MTDLIIMTDTTCYRASSTDILTKANSLQLQ